MRVLRRGMQGEDVRDWQTFLAGVRQFVGGLDGDFGLKTERATKAFQVQNGLGADGVVGAQTLKRAMELGFDPFDWPEDASDVKDPFFPPKPKRLRPLSVARAEELYGKFAWKPAPTSDDERAIKVLDDWAQRLRSVEIPQLAKIGKPAKASRAMHERAVDGILALWQAWEDAGLLKLVKTFDGLYNPRLIGGTTTLSSHAFGAAFDVNADLNPWGTPPAAVGQPGSVRRLVPLANRHGFYWGGHYNGKKDGMHFELVEP